MRLVKTTVYDQNNNIQWYLHIFKAQKIQSPAKQFKELFSLYPNHFRWNGIVVSEVQPYLFLIGYLWVSLIIDQSECLVCYFFCTELTLFCAELSENCIYLNQSELSNFFIYILIKDIWLEIRVMHLKIEKKNINKEQNMKEKPFEVKNELPIS